MVLLMALTTALTGCATLSYYRQSIAGHLRILGQRQDIRTLLQAPGIPDARRAQLQAVPELLRFASDQLGLPDNGSYRTFVALEQPFVAWNVFATPALAMNGVRWCYPVAGCLEYRGYFSETAARTEAEYLRAAGHDVYVGGVAAYSTLGWFKDPVLSSMLRADRLDFAALLFHELAHQRLWLRNDTDLNEAFAETIARIGVEKLAQTWGNLDLQRFHDRAQQDDQFFALVLRHKEQLASLFASNLPAWRKQALKHRQFTALRADYEALKAELGEPGRFDHWLESDLNNAKLLAVTTYRDLVPGLLQIYQHGSRDLETFYALLRGLQDCSLQARHDWVRSGGTLPECWTSGRNATDS
jgi:predicted aminopeptidase